MYLKLLKTLYIYSDNSDHWIERKYMHVVPIKTIQNINGHDNAKAEFFLRKETSHGDTD